MIAEAMQKVGNEGVITVEEAKTAETELEVVEGMQFDVATCRFTSSPTLKKMVVDPEDALPSFCTKEARTSRLFCRF